LSEEDEAHYQEVKEMIDEWRLAHQYGITSHNTIP